MKKTGRTECVDQASAEFKQNINGPNTKLVVVGGAGCNFAERVCLNRLLEKEKIDELEIIAINTDEKRLGKMVGANKKLLLGVKVTKGKGAAYPEVGQYVAEESKDAIREVLEGADMVIILGNAGGGTAGGVMPVIAGVAREQGALVVCIVSKPFSIEGDARKENAETCIKKLRGVAHTVLELHNDSMIEQFSNMSIEEVFLVLDRVALKVIKNMVDNVNKTVAASFLVELENLLKDDTLTEDELISKETVSPTYEIPMLVEEGGEENLAIADLRIDQEDSEAEMKKIDSDGGTTVEFIQEEKADGGAVEEKLEQQTTQTILTIIDPDVNPGDIQKRNPGNFPEKSEKPPRNDIP